MANEKHGISRLEKNYQLLHRDENKVSKEKDTILAGKFYWKSESSDFLEKLDLKLFNVGFRKERFVLVDAFWCPDLSRLEVHITRNDRIANDIEEKNNIKLSGISFKEYEKIELIFRVNDNTIDPKKPKCEKNISVLNPDDKDGSILIGERP